MTQRVPQPGDFAQIGCMWCRNPLRNPLHHPFGPSWALRTGSSHSLLLAGTTRWSACELLLEEVAMRAFTPQGTCLQQVQTCRHPQFYSPCTTDTCAIRVTLRVPQPFAAGAPPPELPIFAPKWRFWAIFGQKCPFLREVKNGAKICANFKIFGPRGAQDFGPQNP